MFKKISSFLFVFCLLNAPVYAADDLDDGIAGDDAIVDSIQLQRNINYIKSSAIKKANQGTLKGLKGANGTCGAGNQTFGPGTNLQGATIVNLSNNKGATSVCTK